MNTKTAVITLVAMSGVALGGIVSIEGGIVKNNPDINDPQYGYGEANYVQGFAELQGITLTQDIVIQLGDGSMSVLQAGTVVDSHMVYYDPEGELTTDINDIEIQFSSEILGLIVLDLEIASTNGLLGLAGLNYANPSTRSYGPNGIGDIELYSGSLLNVSLRPTGADYFRVLTVSNIPTPGSVALLSAAGLIGIRRRR
ncbi:MAG: hypothetical protein JKY43_10410 [Phycisphaerales bacterium]|nr:hypothetical protein [Phycisphaerales bacterium]